MKTKLLNLLFFAGLSYIFSFVLCVESMGQQQIQVEKISENTNIRSDQRPISIGFYDEESQKTYISWMGANSHPIMKEFDHKYQKWSEDKVVGQSPFVDKHNYPGLLKGKDGRLFLFYGCHNSTLKMAISPKPNSIDGIWEDSFIETAERASYPAPVITDEGDIYVFYRDTRKTNGYSDDRPYQLVKTTDGGNTWARQMVIDPFPRETDNMTEVYNGKVVYQPSSNSQKAKIHLAWTICGEKKGKHAHATYGRNLYYAYLNPSNDHLYNIEGKDLGKSIDANESDQYCIVLDTGIPEKGHLAGLQVSVHFRDNGLPLVHFLDNRKGKGISSATWENGSWNISKITSAGGDPRELEKTGPDSFRVYRPNGDKIDTYITNNGGISWSFENSIYVGQIVDRVHVIDNYHPDAKLLITENGDGELREAKRDVFIGKLKR